VRIVSRSLALFGSARLRLALLAEEGKLSGVRFVAARFGRRNEGRPGQLALAGAQVSRA